MSLISFFNIIFFAAFHIFFLISFYIIPSFPLPSYHINTFPHIAVIDPRTGASIWVYNKKISKDIFCEKLMDFLGNHPYPDGEEIFLKNANQFESDQIKLCYCSFFNLIFSDDVIFIYCFYIFFIIFFTPIPGLFFILFLLLGSNKPSTSTSTSTSTSNTSQVVNSSSGVVSETGVREGRESGREAKDVTGDDQNQNTSTDQNQNAWGKSRGTGTVSGSVTGSVTGMEKEVEGMKVSDSNLNSGISSSSGASSGMRSSSSLQEGFDPIMVRESFFFFSICFFS